MRKITLALLLMAASAIAACHTVQGAGEDIESGGRHIENGAR